jgi:hypothetical protein
MKRGVAGAQPICGEREGCPLAKATIMRTEQRDSDAQCSSTWQQEAFDDKRRNR